MKEKIIIREELNFVPPEYGNSGNSETKPEIIKRNDDVKGRDLSKYDFRGLEKEVFLTLVFDEETCWPPMEKLPPDFSPQEILKQAMNPGLGVKELHKEGIDGRGIKVAIIDQRLLPNHKEYKGKIRKYQEIGKIGDAGDEFKMHGTAVSSLLVGENCGTASGAELYYYAIPTYLKDYSYWAEALRKIIEYNKEKSQKEQIKIVSCSVGYNEKSPNFKNVEEWKKALKEAQEAGIIVIHVSMENLSLVGCGLSEKENVNTCRESEMPRKLDVEKIEKEIVKLAEEIELAKRGGIIPEEVLRKNEKILEGGKKFLADTEKRRKRRIFVQIDQRTTASYKGEDKYTYWGNAGISWAEPYLAGVIAMALQINPDLKREEIYNLILKTATEFDAGKKIVNPKTFIEKVKELIGKG